MKKPRFPDLTLYSSVCHSEQSICHSELSICHSERSICHSEQSICHSEQSEESQSLVGSETLRSTQGDMRKMTLCIIRQKGSIYTLTLAASLVLVAVVLGISYQILQYRQTARGAAQIDQATVYAELGIRHALHYTSQDNLWRQNLSSGRWLEDIAVGDAVYSVDGVDPVDGLLMNNSSDPVELTCTATVGDVTRAVHIKAVQQPYDILHYAVVAGGDVFISNHVQVTGDVTSNNDINKSGGDTWIFGNAEAVGTIDETDNITGTVSLPADKQMVMPGDNAEIDIELIHPVAMEKGLKFAIREGGRTVASGQVTDIIE